MKTKHTEKPPMITDPVELARQRVAELNGQELKFAKQSVKTFGDLADLRSKRGRAVLEGAVPSEVNREIRELEDSLETSVEAAAAARELRLVAIDALRQIDGDDLERQGAQLDVDAAANETAVREALKTVEQLADCPYVPQPPRAPDRAIGPGQQGVGAVVIVNAPRPLFQRLRLRAESLRLEAAQRRLQEPHAAGSVEADSLEHLVELVHSDAMRVGPPIADIARWFEQTVDKVRKRRQQLELEDAPINVGHLQWVRGQIDVAASFVSSSTQSTPGVQTIDTDADFAAAAATETQPQAPKPHAPKNVIFGGSATAKQEVDLDDEYARAAATEQR